ncbi:MAG TPA: hypothetical protein VGR29_12490 [Thermomicrobiales bacterium]|nr:hypothetical protein [Thermomicrobiales bacterium]
MKRFTGTGRRIGGRSGEKVLKQPRILVRSLLLLSIIYSLLYSGTGVSAVAAQAGATSFTSPMTGSTIYITGSWTIDTASVASQDGIESITLTGPYDFMQVWFMPAGLDLVAARDIILDSFATEFGTFVEIDRGAYGDVSYSLDMTSSEGVEFGVFSLFLGQRASGFVEYYVYFGPVIYFQQGFAAAQQSITVNGNPVFSGVDGAGLQNLLSANAGAAGGAVQPPAGEVVPGNQPPAAPTQVPAQVPAQPTAAAPPAAPTEAPAPPPSDPAAASGEGAAYLTTLQSELGYIQTTITDATAQFGGLEGDNSAAAIEAISRIAAEWSAYPDRAAGIVAPAGYEGIHASYQALAGQVGQLGTSWSGFVDSIQTGDVTTIQSTLQTFLDQFVGIQGQVDALNAQIAESQVGSVAEAQPTAAPATAATEVAPAQDSGEGAAYISAIQAELTYLEGTLSNFATKLRHA